MNPSKGWSRRGRGLLCSHMEPISHCGRHPRCSGNILPRSTAHPLPRRGETELNVTLQPLLLPLLPQSSWNTPELLAASAVTILLSCHCHVIPRHGRLPSPVALVPSCLLCGAAPCKVAKKKSLISNFLLPFFPHPGKKKSLGQTPKIFTPFYSAFAREGLLSNSARVNESFTWLNGLILCSSARTVLGSTTECASG